MPWVFMGDKGWGGKGYGGKSWGGKGKSWGGKGVKKASGAKTTSLVVPADFQVNTSQRHTGTVSGYFKFNGYGFVTLDKKGVVPEDKVFVHWTDIQSSDRFPQLMRDSKVQFNLKKEERKGQHTLRACNVSLPGGAPVSVQDEQDEKREYVGGQNLRYTGTLKFYIPKRGYGYVTLDEGYELDADVPKELRVETSEVNAGGAQPAYMKDVQVEFGIWKTKKGEYKCYNMTAPGGLVLASS